ncbi:hypothetical protein [Streptomyces radicis]|uniref:Uncharacterized protein n=1 Tax=Streptomyces radicis TaxID=1750517 RepID=A0A3A9WJ43_9ACTN|nr:hypothetical protein [Streptomyces radicis]RKN12799.1 hypothetical protein D7319_02380 [Streptomyces radicis]RKN27436.1 hypothetical protein D7318_00515 [Streptomyces radicis]
MNGAIDLYLRDPDHGRDQPVNGRCWLGCDPEAIQPVVWIGPVSIGGPDGIATAPAYACPRCVRRLYAMARADEIERDRPAHLAEQPHHHP